MESLFTVETFVNWQAELLKQSFQRDNVEWLIIYYQNFWTITFIHSQSQRIFID